MQIRKLMLVSKGQVEIQPDEMELDKLEDDEVAGESLASMISPGTEIQGCLLGDRFPRTSGYACVMRVLNIGQKVSKVKVGDIVFCMGNHRSHQKCRENELAIVPPTLDPQEACCARFMGVSMSTLTTTMMRPPSKVLVMGLGLVGNMACRLFDCCGYEVHAVDLVAGRREQLAGNSRCMVHTQVPVVQDMDLVIDCTGHEQAVLDGSRSLRKGGELVLIGVPWRKRADLQAFDLLHVIFHRYIHLRSGWEWELPRQRSEFDRAGIWSNLQGAIGWLDQKRINIQGIYDVCTPEQCQQAYDRLTRQGDGPLTTVFDWTR